MGNLEYPSVSVIIPVRDEERHIGGAVRGVLEQGYIGKGEVEILIVDGMSKDETRKILSQFAGARLKPGVSARILDNPKGQRASALNIGIRESRGDVIMRIDARTIIPSDYIEKCVRTLSNTKADNAGGIQKPIAAPGALTQKAIGIALSHPFGVGNAHFRTGSRSGYVDTVYLGCFRREVFQKVGLFDEDSAVISEDADMNQRIREAGGKVYLNGEIEALYYPRSSFRDMWRLYFRYGGAKAGNFLKRGKLTAWRQLVPPLFIVSLLTLPALGLFNEVFYYLWASIAGVYIAAIFLISSLLAAKESPGLFSRLLIAFPAIHLSWGLGFWRRLLSRPEPGQYWGY